MQEAELLPQKILLLPHTNHNNHMIRKTLYYILLILLAVSCTSGEINQEQAANRLLQNARTLMREGQYENARDSVKAMRTRYPKAFTARTEGILVMDSIGLLEAQDSLMIVDSIYKAELQIFSDMQTRGMRKDNENYIRQHTKVFRLNQYLDEMDARVKFYLRKIDVDANRE